MGYGADAPCGVVWLSWVMMLSVGIVFTPPDSWWRAVYFCAALAGILGLFLVICYIHSAWD